MDLVDVNGLPMIGAGPVATVHELRDPPAAVKVFPGPLDRFTRTAFDRERAALGALSHVSSIMQVDDVLDASGGRVALRMERCAQSLGQLLDAHGPLSISDALAVGRAVATALTAAHEAGIVHGAVTPHNVLLRATGEPVLADFGLALRRGYPPVRANPAPWAATESLHHNEFTELTDLYGLGAVMCAALTGRPPQDNSADLVPSVVRALVSRLLAPDPAQRPANAAAVLAELTAAATDSNELAGDFTDFPTKPARPAGERFFADWENGTEPEDDRPANARRGNVLGVAAALAVLIAVPVLAGRQPAAPVESPRQIAASDGSLAGFTVPTLDLELDPPIEDGDSVELSWRSEADLDYAVVVAGESLPTKVVMIKRERTLRVPVEPARQYCFLVQGTDGVHVYQTKPRPIRGAVCKL